MLHLEPGEKIIHEVRKHWFLFFIHGLGLAILALLPLVASVLIRIFTEIPLFADGEIIPLLSFFYILYVLILWLIFFIHWTNYYLDVWYITDKRIIDIEQKSIFHRELSNLRFDRIQDVTVTVDGVLATFLHYGDLKVQTAAENSRDFFMHHASHPDKVRKIIFAQHNQSAEKPLHVVSDDKKSIS